MLAGMENVEAAASGRLQRAGAAAPEGGAATSLWCGDAACHGLGVNLGRVGGSTVGSVLSEFMLGRRPRMRWCDARGLLPIALRSLGCKWPIRVALHLESGRWYIGATSLEGSGLG
jgi:hypothetical protein